MSAEKRVVAAVGGVLVNEAPWVEADGRPWNFSSIFEPNG